MPDLNTTSVVVATLATKEGIAPFLANVPKTIEQALDRPPVSELLRAGAKKQMLEATLAAELIKVSNMLSVGGNLKEGQALIIAIQLIDDYPNESLEDFCLCLRQGLKGYYGDIFRFDILVISGWFAKYLEDKYVAVENRLLDEKDDLYKIPKVEAPDPDSHQKWIDKLKEVTKPIGERKIPPIDTRDILTEGQERPKANLHPKTSGSEFIKHELHLEWCRTNFDKYTGDKLPSWKPESEWTGSLTEDQKNEIIAKALKD